MTVAQTVNANIGTEFLGRAERASGTARQRDIAVEKPAVPETASSDPVEAAEEVLNSVVKAKLPANQRLSIDQDEEAKRVVFKAIDRESGETVKQFPTEETLRAIARIRAVTGLGLKVEA